MRVGGKRLDTKRKADSGKAGDERKSASEGGKEAYTRQQGASKTYTMTPRRRRERVRERVCDERDERVVVPPDADAYQLLILVRSSHMHVPHQFTMCLTKKQTNTRLLSFRICSFLT